jgi:hypothetical protein
VDPGLGEIFALEWKGGRGEPFTADELLIAAGMMVEAWFRGPPLGPVPEHLVVHELVFGCVAEYEDRIEELDRWRSEQLKKWLEDRIGRHCLALGACYELRAERSTSSDGAAFRLLRIEDPLECDKLCSEGA